MHRPIGVFDSGVGGISVLKELVALMPNENYIFYGDSKNAPYGTKTLKEVQDLTCADAEYLLEQNVKALVVACNTATSAAIRILRKKYQDQMPVIGFKTSGVREEKSACYSDGNTNDNPRRKISEAVKAVYQPGSGHQPALSGTGGIRGARGVRERGVR